MKKLILSIAMITFIVGTASVSFGQNVEQKIAVLQIDSVADLDTLTKASELIFIENEKSFADLRSLNTTMDTEKKAARLKEIELLEQKNSALREELVTYKKAGKTDWKSFKKQFNSDMEMLTVNIKNLKDPIKK